MYIPGAEKFFATVFGGVKPHMRLSPDAMAVAAPIVAEAARSARWLAFGAGVIMATAGLAATLYLGSMIPPSSHSILDNLAATRWISFSVWLLGSVLFPGLVVAPMLIRRKMGDHRSLYEAYFATKHDWLFSRAMIAGLGFLLLILVGAVLGIRLGERVDNHGIVRDGIHVRSFQSVAKVNTYKRVNAPAGVLAIPSLVVTFKDGTTWFYQPKQGLQSPSPAHVAGFVSAHAGIATTEGDLRP